MKFLFLTLFFLSVQHFAGIGSGESEVKPLPVELTSFNASIDGNSVVLKWTTETEINNFGFQIERALIHPDNSYPMEFTLIGFVNGSGNSNSQKIYSFRDELSVPAKYIYRLKQIDTDGKYRYIKSMEVSFNLLSDYQMFQNYPNPFNPATTISYTLPYESNVTIKIFNSLGTEVRSIVNEKLNSGSYSLSINASDLASGIYFYRIEAYSIEYGVSFIDTKKMTIIK